MLDASDDTGAITYFGHFENTGFRSFGVNNDGELYVAGLASGTIYTVVDIDALSMETFNKQAVTLYPNPAKMSFMWPSARGMLTLGFPFLTFWAKNTYKKLNFDRITN